MTEYEYKDCTAVGVALLTSAIDDPRRFHAAELVAEFVEDGAAVPVLFVGLVNLAELLLADLAEATGVGDGRVSENRDDAAHSRGLSAARPSAGDRMQG